MIEWTTNLPTKAGRYFIRPIRKGLGRVRGYVVTVSDFGDHLVAWAGPELYGYFRMAALDKLAGFLNEPGLEWGYIDDVTDWEWNHAPDPESFEVHPKGKDT